MRKINLLFAMFAMAAFLILQSCTKKEEISIPTVTSFTPTSGLPGSTVTIKGTGFSTTPSKDYVVIAGAQATVTAATTTSITATVSDLAAINTSGKVTVTSNGLTAVSSADFGVTAVPPVATTTVTGEITSDTHWTSDMHILLSGYVYVTSGHTLTIDAGTVIKGDKATKGALIIEQGAKIMAAGTVDKPIIFTSNQPKGQRNYGDWGGVILCGYAKTNWKAYKDALTGITQGAGVGQVEGGPRSLYGGTNDADNSGTMQYCRIEFGGVAFSQDNEINGLTLCAVGNATTIDHIQVSYAGDDSFEWFGGSVNAKYLIAHRGLDDDFDTDNGFSGMVQYGIGLRDPLVADQSGSKAFESDSYQGTTVQDGTLPTRAMFSNFTVVGGVVNPTSTAYDPQFVAAIHMRKGSKLQTANSVFLGYPTGVLLSNEGVAGQSWNALSQNLIDAVSIQNCVFGGMPTTATRIAYGILPFNSAPTANDFDHNIAIVTNNVRSRTPTTPMADSVANSAWFTNGTTTYSGPYNWLGSNTYFNATNNNRCYYTAQTGIRLTSPFNLTNPDFFPSSSSPISVGLYAKDGSGNPIKTGPGLSLSGEAPFGSQASPISPLVSPAFNNNFTNSFFDKVTYIGAIDPTTATNWTATWTNWDPNNADYGAAY